MGLAVALTYCAMVGTSLCFKADWNREVVKVVQRIAAEERVREMSEDGRSVV